MVAKISSTLGRTFTTQMKNKQHIVTYPGVADGSRNSRHCCSRHRSTHCPIWKTKTKPSTQRTFFFCYSSCLRFALHHIFRCYMLSRHVGNTSAPSTTFSPRRLSSRVDSPWTLYLYTDRNGTLQYSASRTRMRPRSTHVCSQAYIWDGSPTFIKLKLFYIAVFLVFVNNNNNNVFIHNCMCKKT